MNVKCQCCGTMIDRNIAFRVAVGKVNKYYCDEDEYNSVIKKRKQKEDTFNKINECFGRTITNSAMFKEINELERIYGYEKICGYVNDNMEYLSNTLMGKTFSSEYAQIRYFTAILKNSLTDYIVENTGYQRHVEIDIPDVKYKSRKKKRPIDDIEQEVGDEL